MRTIYTTAPVPTPVISPSPKAEGTAFYNEIPDTVNQYVLVETAPNEDWEALGAFDAYTLVYSDGTDTLTLLAGQWRTPEEAQEAYAALDATLAEPCPTPSAEVSACVVPSASSTESSTESPTPAGNETEALWANQTAVFHVTASSGGAERFHAAFPM